MKPTIRNLIETLKNYETCENCCEYFELEDGVLTCSCDDSGVLSFAEICQERTNYIYRREKPSRQRRYAVSNQRFGTRGTYSARESK
ncbi:hypothetical protein FACS1894208_01380 [Clostridia bacterium]|nr:hypothetical protein FACS1894208_01380 [Clostridia bacterium]